MHLRFAFAVSAIMSAVSAVSAFADTVDMRFLGTGIGRSVTITTPSRTLNVVAGQLRHAFSNGTGAASVLNGELITYCTDVNQFVSSTVRNYTVVPVGQAPSGQAMGSEKASAVAAIFAAAGGTQFTSTVSADLACAFQLAIWEVVNDYNPTVGLASLSLSSGTFRATQTTGAAVWSSVDTLFNGLLANVDKASFTSGGIMAIASPTYQDQLVSIPAPGAVVLTSLGLSLLARRARRGELA
jgi:hypothetical protein